MREIGGKIRALRKEQRRTLHDLAEAVGTSVSMISQVERGSAQPSIATLWKLADALGVPVVHFFSEPEKPKAMVVRARQQRMLEMTNPAAAYSLLSPDMHRKIEFLKIVLQPGCIDDSELVSHLGEECGYVVSGTLTVRIAAESYVLEPGDAIYFESSMPHRLLNMHTEACVSVWAMTPPTF
ncbi:MAG TPA: helix-turn-helix domain-containing protein [Magnetospirillaceae bacterium]|nr:helix-turn-helix domain-containing protein [Magnetospirillaceae bacterium]